MGSLWAAGPASRRLAEEDQFLSESPIIVFGIAFLSVLVCIFYLWLIKIGALADCLKCCRGLFGKKPKVRPLPKKKKKKKKKKIVVAPPIKRREKAKWNMKTGHEVGKAWDFNRYANYEDEIAEVGSHYANGEGARGEGAAGSGPGI